MKGDTILITGCVVMVVFIVSVTVIAINAEKHWHQRQLVTMGVKP